jgi:hypothetical protein
MLKTSRSQKEKSPDKEIQTLRKFRLLLNQENLILVIRLDKKEKVLLVKTLNHIKNPKKEDQCRTLLE